jgi:hypothetical protein
VIEQLGAGTGRLGGGGPRLLLPVALGDWEVVALGEWAVLGQWVSVREMGERWAGSRKHIEKISTTVLLENCF